MEVDKKRSKGGFLNLFDWNGKSRKKLFSSNSESSGRFIFSRIFVLFLGIYLAYLSVCAS